MYVHQIHDIAKLYFITSLYQGDNNDIEQQNANHVIHWLHSLQRHCLSPRYTMTILIKNNHIII